MTAFSADALWSKSVAFAERALLARDEGDQPSFHLWAALSIELLAKAALSNVHPALVADPNDLKSLMGAFGIKDPTDKRSITAKAVYERLTYLNPDFDVKLKDTCMFMANRRNAELHSGESPIEGLEQQKWVPGFWKAASVILATQSKSLQDWVGIAEATRIEKVLEDSTILLEQSVEARIARRGREYVARFASTPKERTEALRRASSRGVPRSIASGADEVEEVDCPACSAKAWLLGYEWNEEIIDSSVHGNGYDYEPWEIVRTHYNVDGFRCVECGLTLDGRDEIAFAKLEAEFEREVEREPDYEPDYGND